MAVSGATITTPVIPTDITRIVSDRAKKTAIVHDLDKLPPPLIEAVRVAATALLKNQMYSFEQNGQATTASGEQLTVFLQSLKLSPAKIALTLHALATTHRKTAGRDDNIIHIPISQLLRDIANNDQLNNAFFAQAQKAMSTKKLDPFFKQERNPLDFIHITAQPPRGPQDMVVTKNKNSAPKKVAILSTGKLLALGKRLGLFETDENQAPNIKEALKELRLLQGAV